MSKRKLSEPQAWREVARAVFECRGGTDGFLCRAIEHQPSISLDAQTSMRTRLHAHLGGNYLAYNHGPPPLSPDPIAGHVASILSEAEGREARVLAALWMALEAEDEART